MTTLVHSPQKPESLFGGARTRVERLRVEVEAIEEFAKEADDVVDDEDESDDIAADADGKADALALITSSPC